MKNGPRNPCSRRRPVVAPVVALLLVLVAASPVPVGASGQHPRGFAVSRTDTLYSHDRRLMAAIDPVTAASLFDRVAAAPRVSGTAEASATADWLEERLRGWGWEVERRSYRVYLPHVAGVAVERLRPTPISLAATEPEAGQAEDDASYAAAAGYSAAGDVSAPVVYANRGTDADFRRLEEAGVTVAGAVVLIRYGDLFRGAKVSRAQRAGAAAVLLYSDPEDDGFGRGRVLPEGPFRPPEGIERGSVKVATPGDPTTPGWPSTEGARRTRPAGPEGGTPEIPVVAIGYGAAAELLRPLRGELAPASWQGGLPFAYRLGGTADVTARVHVELDDRPYKTITNVLARRDGTGPADRVVMAGAHYDSWTEGAVDNASGTVSLLLVARAFARLDQLGMKPARSVVLAFWDAEEWGLVGSTEYVEDRAALLDAELVAYLNQDGVAGGPFFAASASPSLARLLREVTLVVPDPIVGSSSVYQQWVARTRSGGGEASLTPPGAGSDHDPFFSHLGVPVASFGFHGASGVYHSRYDDASFMRRFGDPGFEQHVASARVTALALWRLADADVLPLDYADYGRVVLGHVRELPRFAASAAALATLERSAEGFLAAAIRLEQSSSLALTGSAVSPFLANANRELMGIERSLTRAQGLPGRPWYRNVVFAPDAEDAYAVVVFPGIASALRTGDPAHLRAEMIDLATRLDEAAGRLRAAGGTVGTGGALRVGGR